MAVQRRKSMADIQGQVNRMADWLWNNPHQNYEQKLERSKLIGKIRDRYQGNIEKTKSYQKELARTNNTPMMSISRNFPNVPIWDLVKGKPAKHT